MMARQKASLRATPAALAEALQLVVSMTPQGPGQQIAQREIIAALGTALDARRQRIIISQAEVNSVKWWCLYLQAICELCNTKSIMDQNARIAAQLRLLNFLLL
jgi:hypothetical protein